MPPAVAVASSEEVTLVSASWGVREGCTIACCCVLVGFSGPPSCVCLRFGHFVPVVMRDGRVGIAAAATIFIEPQSREAHVRQHVLHTSDLVFVRRGNCRRRNKVHRLYFDTRCCSSGIGVLVHH